MKNRYTASQPFRFLGLGRIRLGLFLVVFTILGSVMALLSISAMSSHFAYASTKVVPIPPKRPDVMSASPSYIHQLMQTNNHDDVYNDAFSYDHRDNQLKKDYEEEIFASLQKTGLQTVPEALDDNNINIETIVEYEEYEVEDIIYKSGITENGVPLPGHKPDYGVDSLVQRVEDFSNYPSSVKLALIDPEAGGHYSDAYNPNELMLIATEAVRQPITKPGHKDREEALVSFTLDPDQVALDPNLKEFLLNHAVKTFKSDPRIRLEIHAYASTENEQEYSDVRRSLARALEVRSFLLDQNIDPSRLKITPMGQDTGDTTDDRIDLLFIVSKK